jgi:osmotically-inducible protein OsmY
MMDRQPHTDSDLAQAALDALTWTAGVPEGRITVSVQDGHIVLRGAVDWPVQREAAASAVSGVIGVQGITNDIVVEPRTTADDVRRRIEAAFRRNADIDARHVKVSVDGHTVTLTGSVRSWPERQAAEEAALAAPGISTVEDHLSIVR